jgi:hypothetical protein
VIRRNIFRDICIPIKIATARPGPAAMEALKAVKNNIW